MAKKGKKELSKKVIAMSIFTRLDTSLSEYHNQIGEKKYTNHLKKTAKLFANDIADAAKKEQEKIKKEAKKLAKKSGKKSASKAVKKNVKKTARKAPLKKKIDSNLEVALPPETKLPDLEKPAE